MESREDFYKKRDKIQAKIDKIVTIFGDDSEIAKLLEKNYTEIKQELQQLYDKNKDNYFNKLQEGNKQDQNKEEKLQEVTEVLDQLKELNKQDFVQEKDLEELKEEKEKIENDFNDLQEKLKWYEEEAEKIKSQNKDLQKKMEQNIPSKSSDNKLYLNDITEKVDILNSFKLNYLDLITIIQKSNVDETKFREEAKAKKLSIKDKLSKDYNSFQNNNKKYIDDLNDIIKHIQEKGFFDSTSNLKDVFKPFYAPYSFNEDNLKEKNEIESDIPDKDIIQDNLNQDLTEDEAYTQDLTKGETYTQDLNQSKDSRSKNNENFKTDGEEIHQQNTYSKGKSTDKKGMEFEGDYPFRDKVYTLIEKIENSKVDIHSISNSSGGYIPTPSTPFPSSSPPATSVPSQPEPPKEEEDLPEASKEQPEEANEEPEKKEEKPKPAFNPYKQYDEFEEDDFESIPEEPQQQEEKQPEKKKQPQASAPPAKKDKLDIRIHDDDLEIYGNTLKLTYLFDNMPNNLSYSKYKPVLRNACRITLLGNLQEGLDLFNMLKQQNIPPEYIEMIDKNIRDVKYYLRGRFRSKDADEGMEVG